MLYQYATVLIGLVFGALFVVLHFQVHQVLELRWPFRHLRCVLEDIHDGSICREHSVERRRLDHIT